MKISNVIYQKKRANEEKRIRFFSSESHSALKTINSLTTLKLTQHSGINKNIIKNG